MEAFLVELLDLREFNPIDISKEFIEDGALIYSKVFASQLVKNQLSINWLFKNLLSFVPPRSVFWTLDPIFSVKPITFDEAVKFLIQNTLQMNCSHKQADFEAYVAKLDDIAFVKSELFKKLSSRLQKDKPVFNFEKTLFSQFPVWTVNPENATVLRNPITKTILLEPIKVDNLTMVDTFKTIVMNDGHFLQSFVNKCILVYDADHTHLPACIKVFNPDVVVTTRPCIDADFVCADFVSVHLQHATFPSLHDKMYVISDTTESPLSVGKAIRLNLPEILSKTVIIDKSFTHEVLLTYLNSVKQVIAGGMTNFPPNVILYIIDYFAKMRRKSLIPGDTTENCIFLYDNRKNPLSIISTLITLTNLKEPWDLLVLTSKENEAWYKNYLPVKAFLTHDIVKMQRKFKIQDYNNLVTDQALWSQMLRYKKCLIVQDDGMLLRKGLEKFLEYDYVGAPWTHNDVLKTKNGVGNGGFSLRNIRMMFDICVAQTEAKHMLLNRFFNIPEDVFFAHEVEKIENALIPSAEIASKFCSEMKLDMDSIAIHKPWAYTKLEDILQYFRKLQNMAPQ